VIIGSYTNEHRDSNNHLTGINNYTCIISKKPIISCRHYVSVEILFDITLYVRIINALIAMRLVIVSFNGSSHLSRS